MNISRYGKDDLKSKSCFLIIRMSNNVIYYILKAENIS